MAHFGDLQGELYSGRTRLSVPVAADRLAAAARAAMSEQAWAYVAGSAGTERTASANTAAFHRRRLVPRMLRGVPERDLTTTLFGRTLAAPLLTAPIGALGLVHPEPELSVVAAAAAVGVGSVVTTMAQATLEQVAAAAPADAVRWFQLYWSADDEVAESMVRRASAAGYGAIVVTVDTWTIGWRPRDLDRRHLPFLSAVGVANHLSDPVFLSRLAAPPDEAPDAAVAAALASFGRPSLTWADLARLRSWTTLPVLVKGILHPDDARAAVDAGVDGVVVSNHGGRQVDGARAALDCLPDVVAAVGDRTTVLFDSGVRSGADLLIVLALGARAVLLGRPWVHGLAVAGRAGVEDVLRCLLAELDVSMALCGHTHPSHLGPDLVSLDT